MKRREVVKFFVWSSLAVYFRIRAKMSDHQKFQDSCGSDPAAGQCDRYFAIHQVEQLDNNTICCINGGPDLSSE